MIENLRMDGLDRYNLIPDVDILRRLNRIGIYSVAELAYRLGVSIQEAEFLCTRNNLHHDGGASLPYLLMMDLLRLDIAWLIKKIDRVECKVEIELARLDRSKARRRGELEARPRRAAGMCLAYVRED